VDASRLLAAALYVQVLLGLARFGLPYVGLSLDPRLWLLHPLNGAAIAAAALVRFRPIRGVPGTPVRVAARFAPLLALALGLGLAAARGLLGPLVGTLLHAAVGLAAVELVGRAAEQQRRDVDRATGSVGPGEGVAA